MSKIRAANLSVCRIHSTPTSLAAVGSLKVPGISKKVISLLKEEKSKKGSKEHENKKKDKGRKEKGIRIKTKKNQVSKVWKEL